MNIASNSQRETIKIRKRGQLTIPDKLRKEVSWLQPNSIVNVYLESNNGIYISPYLGNIKQNSKWDEIWDKIKLARSFPSKTKSLSEFIIKDRKNH